MKQAIVALATLALTTLASDGFAQVRLNDDGVRARIVQESLATYPGNCPCPYNVDRAGRSCGGRSAWIRAGGYSPICYANEVTDDLVRAWRARSGG